MRSVRTSIRTTFLASMAGLASAIACGRDVVAPPPAVAVVTASLGTSSLQVGATTQATAVVKDKNGNVLTDRTVVWSVDNNAVATVSETGMVTAVGPGTARVTATSEGVSGNASIDVAAVPHGPSIAFSAPAVNLTAPARSGAVQQTVGIGNAAQGPLTIAIGGINYTSGQAPYEWLSATLSGNTTPATLTLTANDTTGLRYQGGGSGPYPPTALAPGTYTAVVSITSSTPGIDNSGREILVTLTVTPAPDNIVVTPSSVLMQPTEVRQFGVSVNGATVPRAGLTWASSNTAVATVSDSGYVTAVGDGTAVISASNGNGTGTTSVTVHTEVGADKSPPVLVSLSVSPSTLPINGIYGPGGTAVITARVMDVKSGVAAVSMNFGVQGSTSPASCYATSPISGTRNDGVYRCTIAFPGNAAYGVYHVLNMTLYDQAGNGAYYTEPEIDATGAQNQMIITGDRTTLGLVGFSIAPDSVDIRAGGATVTFALRVANPYLLRSAQIKLQDAAGEQLDCSVGLGSPPVTAYDAATNTGTVPCVLTVNANGIGDGTYTVTSIRLWNSFAGVDVMLTTANLQAAGLPTTLRVVSQTISDSHPPRLLSFLGPDTVKATATGASITFTAHITDETGVAKFYVWVYRPYTNYTPTEYACGGTDSPPKLISGTVLDGIWSCTIKVPAPVVIGTYTLYAVQVWDVRNNVENWSASQLAAAGFTTKVEMVP